MAVSEAHKKASAKWNNSRDSIAVRRAKGEGAGIGAADACAGMSSQRFILASLSEYMKKDV